MEKKKVVVGMSGGVDSSAAAYLLKEQGCDVIGVTMRMWTEGEDDCFPAAQDARRVAKTLDIPFYVFDFRQEFKKNVVDYFTEEYTRGRTPNPCIVCNRAIKWEALLKRGRELGADAVATGHYARIVKRENGRYAVSAAKTTAKDQTYALYRLTQEQLAHTWMPAGDYEKEEIRMIARKARLPVADKPDSQEICFIPDQDYAGFIRRMGRKSASEGGNFVTADGNVLGRHKGIIHYTVGQRKGLHLAMGKPVFVTEIRPETNEVVIGDAEDVFERECIIEDVQYMGVERITDGMRMLTKVRYAHKGAMASLHPLSDGRIQVVFDEPQRAITPGQSAVFYDGGCVAGGGVIL